MKNGTKKYEVVIKRIGRLEGRYPSMTRYYHINVEKGEKGKAASVTWTFEIPEKQVFGTYFLRTTAPMRTSSLDYSHTGSSTSYATK